MKIVIEIDVDKFDGKDGEGCFSITTPELGEPDDDKTLVESNFLGFEELGREIEAYAYEACIG